LKLKVRIDGRLFCHFNNVKPEQALKIILYFTAVKPFNSTPLPIKVESRVVEAIFTK